MHSPITDRYVLMIGAFILNCGVAEMATYQWIAKLSSDPTIRELANGMSLKKRLTLIRKLLAESKLPEEEKSKIAKLFSTVARVLETRNIIAHSPLSSPGDNDPNPAILKIGKMKSDGHWDVVPLEFKNIARDGRDLTAAVQELLKEFRRYEGCAQ